MHLYVNDYDGGEFYEIPLELGEDGVYRGCVKLEDIFALKLDFPPPEIGEPGALWALRITSPSVPFVDHNGVPEDPNYLILDESYSLAKPDMVEDPEGLDFAYIILDIPPDRSIPAYALTMNPNELRPQLLFKRWEPEGWEPEGSGDTPPSKTVYLITPLLDNVCPP